MNKIGAVITVVVAISLLYLFLLVIIPAIVVPMATAANTTMNATSNMTLYPGTSGFLMASPWILWWAPGVIGIGLIVVILRLP